MKDWTDLSDDVKILKNLVSGRKLFITVRIGNVTNIFFEIKIVDGHKIDTITWKSSSKQEKEK